MKVETTSEHYQSPEDNKEARVVPFSAPVYRCLERGTQTFCIHCPSSNNYILTLVLNSFQVTVICLSYTKLMIG